MQIRIMYSMFYNWRIIFKTVSLGKKLVFFRRGANTSSLSLNVYLLYFPNKEELTAYISYTIFLITHPSDPNIPLGLTLSCFLWKENHSASSNNMHNEWRGNMLRVIKTMRIHFRRVEINKSDTWPWLKREEGSSTPLSGLGFLERWGKMRKETNSRKI